MFNAYSQNNDWFRKNALTPNERSEHVRFLQSLDHTLEKLSTSRQQNLLFFINNYHLSNLQADFSLNGAVDKHDVFLFASQWTTLPSSLPEALEMVWVADSGDWKIDELIHGQSRSESRLISVQTIPARFNLDFTFKRFEGSSAGFILWADSTGATGYVIRYNAALRSLILAKIGPRLEEERLDTFPISGMELSMIQLRVETSDFTIRAYLVNEHSSPVLEATNITPLGSHLGWYLYDSLAEFQLNSISDSTGSDPLLLIPKEGEYQPIFDQSVGESQSWYINDHCFIQDPSGTWHLFGTSNTASPLIPLDEDRFIHATASSLFQSPWIKQPEVLQTNTSLGESQLWAPHIVFKDNLYYMYYCAGSQFTSLEYRIHLATSPDLFHWTRYENNPLFTDFFDARDPMIFEQDGEFIMYYTANADRPVGSHIVAYRTSSDLLNWSSRKTAFTYPVEGTFGGPTESPYVVQYQNQFYLFIGPENLNTTPDEDYRRTAVYRSSNPYHWDVSDRITSVRSHAAEVIQPADESWYVSHGGWFYDGIYLASLRWNASPSLRFYSNLGESLEYVTNHFYAMVSDWRGTGGLDLVADYGSFFDLDLPVPDHNSSIFLEFEEEGETLLRIQTPTGFETLLNEGNTGPGLVKIHKIEIKPNQLQETSIILRFSDSDPTDGWGPNVNWIRLSY